MITTILFDMDGLMFDTERLSNEIFRGVAETMGLPVPDELLRSMKGRNKEDCRKLQIAYWGEDTDFATFRHLYDTRREAYLKEHGVPVKPGLYDLLSYLKRNHYSIGLATSTASEKAVSMLTETNILSYFDQIVYGNEVEKGKPYPDIYLECACRLGASPANCLVLEDSPPGIESGYSAGCHVIMIPDMIEPTITEVRRVDTILPSLSDVIEWISIL